MIAIDTNVLVYAHREEMPLHARAVERLRSLAEGSTSRPHPAPGCSGQTADRMSVRAKSLPT